MGTMEDLDLNFEEDLAVAVNASDAETKFDEAIGHIEDIIMDENFQEVQQTFFEKYYNEFDESEENKLIYTDIHNEYVQLIESYLQRELSGRMKDFSMEEFQQQLQLERNRLDGEVFEMLLTFTDFLAFKEVCLDYKKDKEGRNVDFSAGIYVRSLSRPPDEVHSTDNLAAGEAFGLAPVVTQLSDARPPGTSSQIHNLQIGGHSFLLSTPCGDADGASHQQLDFSQGLVGMALGGAAINGKPDQLEQGDKVVTIGDYRQAERRDGVENMNITPRSYGETSPRDMDFS